MKYLLLLTFLFCSPLFGALTPKRKVIYECAAMTDESKVERVFIYETRLGATDYHEVEIIPSAINSPNSKSKFVKVIFSSKYNNKFQIFSRGRVRMQINRALPREKKYPSSAYIAEYAIQTSQWTCKDL